MIEVSKRRPAEVGVGAKDIVSIIGIAPEVYDKSDNTWKWRPFYPAESWTDFDGSMGDPGPSGTVNVGHFKIMNRYADNRWKIQGECAANTGEWSVKVRVGDTVANSVEYNPTVQFGEWSLILPALGPSSACWVWYTNYVHTPANMWGLTVHNCMRVRTMD